MFPFFGAKFEAKKFLYFFCCLYKEKKKKKEMWKILNSMKWNQARTFCYVLHFVLCLFLFRNWSYDVRLILMWKRIVNVQLCSVLCFYVCKWVLLCIVFSLFIPFFLFFFYFKNCDEGKAVKKNYTILRIKIE